MTERPSGLGGDLCGYFIDCIRTSIILNGALVVRYIPFLCESHSIVNLNLCIILRYSSLYPVVRFNCIVPRKAEFKINYYMPEA